jgi:hypothetical protein
MSNPLSGHTAAQGFASASGLRDGDGLSSPSLTNPYEGLHGNGILRVADGAYGSTRNATGASTEGHVAVGAGGTVSISGGYAVLDGVIYEFGGGVGGTHTTTVIGTTTNYVGSLPTPHASIDKEVYVVIYVAAMGANDNIMYEVGTLADPVSETPLVPSTFLSAPGPADNQQATVLAVLHYTVSAGGTFNASLSTPVVHDKRVFIRPNPVYFNHLTAGAAGSVTSTDAIDNTNQVSIDTIFTSPSDGDFTASPFGSVWQTHSPDGHSVLLYSAQRDIGGTPARDTWRLAPNEVKVLTTSANQTFTFDGPNIWVVTTGAAIDLNPSGSFPHGHVIEVYHPSGAHNLNFDSSGINVNVAATNYAKFVYDGSAWVKLDLHVVS